MRRVRRYFAGPVSARGGSRMTGLAAWISGRPRWELSDRPATARASSDSRGRPGRPHEREFARNEGGPMGAAAPKKRILIIGGGFGGVYTARHLERLLRHKRSAEVVLVSRENYFLMTPLLFDVA